jgi:hypothetical protein
LFSGNVYNELYKLSNKISSNDWEWENSKNWLDESKNSPYLFGHTSIIFQNKLYLYGGFINHEKEVNEHIYVINLNDLNAPVRECKLFSEIPPGRGKKKKKSLFCYHIILKI